MPAPPIRPRGAQRHVLTDPQLRAGSWRNRLRALRVPPPITVHHAAPCEANRPSTTVNLNVTMRGDFNIQGALVMADGLDVVAEIQNLMVPPSAPPVPPP